MDFQCSVIILTVLMTYRLTVSQFVKFATDTSQLDSDKNGVSSVKLIHNINNSCDLWIKFTNFNRKFTKFKSISCSTSNKTLNQQYCKIKPVNRSTSYLNMGSFSPRPMKSIFITFNVSFRPPLGDKYRYIFGIKGWDGCNILRLVNDLPPMKSMLIFVNETILQGLIRTCPYPAGYYKVVNASMPRESLQKLAQMQIFPNGDFKIFARIFNKQDDNIFTINLVLSSSWRYNHLVGNDNIWECKLKIRCAYNLVNLGWLLGKIRE